MTIQKPIFKILTTTAILATLSVGCALNAAAETDIYRDVLMPNGHARNMAAKRADARACGAPNMQVSDADFPRVNDCMRDHGWVIDHIVRSRAENERAASNSTPYPQNQQVWQGVDDDTGEVLNCRSILGGFGSVCTNF